MRESPRAVPEDTVVRQRRASDPLASAWVAANAGSGKTHVLTQRVVRLLLAGVPPSRILCLTFTKAAAATMSIRVFETLARWTRLDDAALRGAIATTGAPAPSEADLLAARRLFARTVETPGGLKIQTIHAFCERLLHLFPFEANVPARFEVLDDPRGADLLARAREATLSDAMRSGGSVLAKSLALLSRDTASDTFDALIAEALTHRDVLRAAPDTDVLAARLGALAGLAPGDTVERIGRRIVEDGIAPGEWEVIARTLGADGGDTRKAGNRLAIAATATPEARCEAYADVFLTEGEPRKDTYLLKAFRAKEPDLTATLDAERDRVAALVPRLKAARIVLRTSALVALAAAVLDHYDTLKQAHGLLDFDDLIERTRTLLVRSDAAWVLYKLDSGIDHILVDEAQDTSPAQWEILRAISVDFFAGAGRSRALRTFFAVGDEKQSIYSFQGARPDQFGAMKRHFSTGARNAGRDFADVGLLLSFRSAPAILRAVDRVFAHPENAAGLGEGERPPPHQALKSIPGLVEIWPPVLATPIEEPRDWRLPVDVVDPGEPPVVLARRVADAIRRWTMPQSGETVDAGKPGGARRPMRPGDVMILVRARGTFFEAMIRALKERHVPVAGADRLSLTDHIAVMDLMAAGRTALTPEDDFTLACVLKSPLIGLDDDDLIGLAPDRRGSLFDQLRASGTASHAAAARTVETWRENARHLTPFGFYTRILSAGGGRRALLGRLGPEAGDAIDEFIALTLAHERDGAPSLLAFLARLEGTNLSVKRDMDAAGDAVRVMTVHAAKGLEAKVVILPDTCGVPSGRHDPKLFRVAAATGEEALLWSPKTDADAGPVGAAREAARRRAVEEYNRLLYVAMTRAEERLYVAAFCGEKGPPADCWYDMIGRAGLDLETVPAPWNAEDSVGRLTETDEAGAASDSVTVPVVGDAALPAWLTRAAPRETDAAEPPVRPSNPLGAADQFAPVAWSFRDRHPGDRRAGLARGRLMHKLLQHLPDVEPGRRRDAAVRFLAAQGGGESESHQGLVDQAIAVIEDPALAAVFGPGSRAEVAIAASVRLAGGRSIEVTGQIDRIGVDEEAVHIADYKTGRPVDVIEARHLLQLALYRAAVAPLYPDRPVRCHLVFTAGPRVIEIAPEALDAALAGMR